MDALVLLVLSTVAAALLVPDLSLAARHLPTLGAVVVVSIALAVIVVLRVRGRSERVLLAVVLAAMPTVYLLSWLLYGSGAPWLWLELGGQVVFVALAFAGVRGSPWFLVAGLAGHGLSDLAHLGRTPFMPDWYAWACLILDLPWAIYAATRVAAWSTDTTAR